MRLLNVITPNTSLMLAFDFLTLNNSLKLGFICRDYPAEQNVCLPQILLRWSRCDASLRVGPQKHIIPAPLDSLHSQHILFPVSGMRTQGLWRASLELWTPGCRSQEGCVYIPRYTDMDLNKISQLK